MPNENKDPALAGFFIGNMANDGEPQVLGQLTYKRLYNPND